MIGRWESMSDRPQREILLSGVRLKHHQDTIWWMLLCGPAFCNIQLDLQKEVNVCYYQLQSREKKNDMEVISKKRLQSKIPQEHICFLSAYRKSGKVAEKSGYKARVPSAAKFIIRYIYMPLTSSVLSIIQKIPCLYQLSNFTASVKHKKKF